MCRLCAMASKEMTGHQQQFVEEIDYNEIETEQVVFFPTFVFSRWMLLTSITSSPASLIPTAEACFAMLLFLRSIRQDNLKEKIIRIQEDTGWFQPDFD